MASSFIISLDFEMFWGVWDSAGDTYISNVKGVRRAIPGMLDLFSKYEISATWATVGMLMCRDYEHWRQIVDGSFKAGHYKKISTSRTLSEFIQQNSELFFGPDLVRMILNQGDQEVGSHTFGHFDCSDASTCVNSFQSDLELFELISQDFNFKASSFVFPRNSISKVYCDTLKNHGFGCFRSNPSHFLYSNGHTPKFGSAGRLLRFLDSYVPMSGRLRGVAQCKPEGIRSIPATLFLRPCFNTFTVSDRLKLKRIKDLMTWKAKVGEDFHLWWHPHNFGRHLDTNLYFLDCVLKHYRYLKDSFGMVSRPMRQIGTNTS